jgi:serine phosphatase RsbU (regulator of sigma subunit)
MKKLLLFLSLFFIQFVAFSQDAIIFGTQSNILNIGKQAYLLEDKEGKLTFDDIQKPEFQNKFKKSEQEIPNFNTTRSTIWVKLSVHNQTDERIYLEVAQALAWYIDFYKPNTEGKLVLTTQTGMMRPFKNREVDNNFFLFELAENPLPQTYYFSIKSDFPLTIPLSLASKQTQMVKNNFYNWFFGGFSGLIIIMFFYNLFVAYSVQDKLYLYYCAYLLSTLIIINYVSGNFSYQLNPISYYSQYFILFTALNASIVSVFLISLLSLNKTTSLYRVLIFWLILCYIFTSINIFKGGYLLVFDLVQLSVLLTFTYILGYCIRLYYKGNKSARFVLFGFSFYMLSMIIYVLQNFGLLVTNFFTNNAIVLGSSIEILLFSLALGDRINRMRKEKELAQADVLLQTKENEKILAEQNEVLAQKVTEKTRDLQTAFEEIQTTNEELFQTQEEILAQRDLLESKNNLLEQYTNKIGKSIGAAQTIQKAILPPKAKMKELFEEHFVLFRPKDIVSGDFWWANEIDGKKYLIVADCTGHGVSGAMLTMIGSALLDRIIRLLGVTEPAEILAKLHEEIKAVLQQDQTKNNEGMDIAITHWHYENEDCFLSFAAAKRPLLYAYQGQIEKIAGSRRNIGGKIDSMKSFENKTFTLSKGTCLYLSSDGFADQNDVARNNFSEKRLINLLQQIQDLPMEQQKEILQTQLTEHTKGAEQRDDILVIGVRI